MPELNKVPVRTLTLLKRINARLAADGRGVKPCRPTSTNRPALGAFFEVDLAAGTVVATHVDLEARARELGALRSYEVAA